jgi:plasmid maintenance system killer protein
MEISFKSRKLKASLEDAAQCRKAYGTEMSKKIGLRMAALHAAETLVDFWPPNQGPERCHRLTADRAGTFSMDVKHPYRLLFAPIDVQEPEPDEERDRWAAIRSIEILGIEDTHE